MPNLLFRPYTTKYFKIEENCQKMESQIIETLFKMEKLSKMIPQEDARTIKALEDFSELN